MAAPTDPLVIWATDDVVLPVSGQQNKIRPQDSLISTGWDQTQKPSAEEFNYLLNNLAQWIEYYGVENIADVLSDYYTKTETDAKTINAGTGLIDGGALGTNPTINMGTPSTVGNGSTNSVAADTHNHALTLTTSNVSILTGTIADGGTIPLPAGYTQAQCYWMVSISQDNPSSVVWDVDEESDVVHYRFECSADINRVVTSKTYIYDYNIEGIKVVSSLSNYIIIGVK